MAATKKRSLSDMQAIDASAAKINDDDTYRMMVLKFEQTEDEVDQHFLQTALELGINVPQDPSTTLNLITNGISGLEINNEPSEPLPPSPTRESHSIHTASDSSIEQQGHRKTPSLAATSLTSASLSSVASNKSNISRVRKSFRRISRIQRRKTVADPVPAIPPRNSSRLQVERPGIPSSRASTTDQIPTISHLQPHAISTDTMDTLQIPQQRFGPITYDPSHQLRLTTAPPLPHLSPPEDPAEETLENISARRRSISNPILKKLRTTQLQEQLRFISFEASQHRLIRTKQLQQKRETLSHYQQKQNSTHTRHAEALTSLENRHLNAEVELNRALELERQACDTRLKHMQAYCNPRSTVEGMPNRVVTKSDYRQLEQQYHIRNGMDNLHASRINVLRERQAKQLERIIAKQETELETLESDFERQNEELEATFRAEEAQVHHEFGERRNRLIARWNIAEAIERRRLEIQSGEEHGTLPVISWSSRPSIAETGSGSSPVSSKGRSRDGFSQAQDANSVWDAMNVI